MNTYRYVNRIKTLPLWGPNDGASLKGPRGHLAGTRAVAKYRRWQKLAERLRFLPPAGAGS